MKYRQAMKLLKKAGPARHWGYAFVKRWIIESEETRELIQACRSNVRAQKPPVQKALKRRRRSEYMRGMRTLGFKC